jgi:hypothetical protein
MKMPISNHKLTREVLMSAQHVAKAAAVLIAASAIAVPAIKTPDDTSGSRFVQVLMSPDQGNQSIVSMGSTNNGCCDLLPMMADRSCRADDIEAS